MKPKSIEVSYGVTLNMGKYQSLKLSYTVGSILDESNSISESLNKTRESIRTKLSKDVQTEIDFWTKS